MGTFVRRLWDARIAGLGVPRRDRAGGRYEAYLPDPLVGRAFSLDGPVAADVADATAAVTRFDVVAEALTSSESLARLLLRAEAVASSRIEGLSVSPQRLLRADIARAEGFEITDDTAHEVLANVDAMTYAVTAVSSDISVKQILEVHRRLLIRTRNAKHAGVVRDEQNWIGGSDYNPINAAFVPPPPEVVPDLLADLAAFCNDDALPAIAQAAIAHAQFETIHPFVDGNGRAGRALIYMVLRRRGLAVRATPPISLALATRAKEYVRTLGGTRIAGSPSSDAAIDGMNQWIGFFAASATRAVADAESFERTVRKIQTVWRARLGSVRSDSSALLLLSRLAEMPVFTVAGVAKMLGRSFPAANAAIDRLVDARILTPVKIGARNRVFEARDLINAFTTLERRLASPDGDTPISPPARAVPRRPQR